MINTCIIIGRVTKDIDLRKTQSGTSVAQFTLACDRGKDKGTDFIACVAWEKSAEIIAQYVHKGDLFGVTGRIQTRNYDDRQTGKKVYVTEVIVNGFQFLESRKQQTQPQNNYGQQTQNNYSSEPDMPLDLPF